MAKDDKPNASDKGKGKVDDIRELNGEKSDDKSKSENDDKPMVNGKKDEEPKDGMSRPTSFPVLAFHALKLPQQ
jgi:26S proteasome regulatory subunit N1